jgi:CspA family cold shock protein
VLCGSNFLLSLLLAPGVRLSVFGTQKKEIDMPIGTVKFFDNAKGYGFITNEAGGNDAFVHMTAVQAAGMSSLEKEQRLSYDLENDQRGKTSAVNLQSA